MHQYMQLATSIVCHAEALSYQDEPRPSGAIMCFILHKYVYTLVECSVLCYRSMYVIALYAVGATFHAEESTLFCQEV